MLSFIWIDGIFNAITLDNYSRVTLQRLLGMYLTVMFYIQMLQNKFMM